MTNPPKNIIKILFVFLMIISVNAFSGIKQINKDLYAARIPGKNVSLVMERIDARTHPLWYQYSLVQSSPRVVTRASKGLKGGSTGEGANHFKLVFETVDYRDNEVWVAYITKNPSPEPIPDGMRSYSIAKVGSDEIPFARDIEMYVTVTSSPNALLTSHMGIASTAEGAIKGRAKGTSIDLHSFAAKVMLARNPGRRYMVNAPAFEMEKTILAALPSFTFVGTKEMHNLMQERQRSTFADFKRSIEATAISKDREKSCLGEIDAWHKEFKSRLAQGEKEENIRQEMNVVLDPKNPKNSCLMAGKDGNPVLDQEKISQWVEEKLTMEFPYFKYPFVSSDDIPRDEGGRILLAIMKEHPPILSVDGHNGNSIDKQFTVFDKGRPWPTITRNNKDYQWIFTEPFEPSGSTHFIAVDLPSLASSKPVE